jgi:hypothetical protein
MYISGFWLFVLFIAILAVVDYSIRSSTGTRGKPMPRFDPEAERRHETTREEWRKVLAENRPLTEREQAAYMGFVSLDTTIKKSVAEGKGNVYSFSDGLAACEEQRKQIVRANVLLTQLDAACARCDQEERLTGRKDGPSRTSTLAMAEEIETLLLRAGDVNRHRLFREQFSRWRDLPLAADPKATQFPQFLR